MRKFMKRIAFLLVAVAIVSGVVASASSGQNKREAAPIFVKTIPPGYRDWKGRAGLRSR
jgi:hypothetical protein